MSNQSMSNKVAPFATGFGIYYIFVWVFSFSPAFIIAFALQRLFFGIDGTQAALFGVEGEGGSYIFGLMVMIVGTFVILGLIALRQYLIVLMIYILTAWPFLYILSHWWNNTEDHLLYPLPLDLWPLW